MGTRRVETTLERQNRSAPVATAGQTQSPLEITDGLHAFWH